MHNIKLFKKIDKHALGLFGAEYNISEDILEPDAILVRSADMHAYNAPASLKAIARAGIGVNNIPVDACAEKGIVVFNTPGANANAVKELAIASLLLASRDILGGVAWARTLTEDVAAAVEKGKGAFVGPEITGKTLGLYGMGATGALTANAGVGMGMEVIGVDPYMTVENAMLLTRSVRRVYENRHLWEHSDYIVLHATLTNETRGIINKDSISHMKDGVRIVNLSRAELVDDADMAAALESGKVAKYVTDFPNEAVLKMKNAIAIPHLGASTPESEDNCAKMAVSQLREYLETGNIRNSVNYPNLSMEHTAMLRVCLLHRNIPNIISQISAVIGGYGINIEHMTNRSRGDWAYTICEINDTLPFGIEDALIAIEGMVRINVIR